MSTWINLISITIYSLRAQYLNVETYLRNTTNNNAG